MKVSCYARLSNYEDSLNKNCILYIYAKNSESIENQQFLLKDYCESLGLNPIKVYIDTGKNFLDDKEELNLMLLENTDNDIIVFDESRLSRKMEDLVMINKMCSARNLRIFSYKTGCFVFEQLKMFNFEDMEI